MAPVLVRVWQQYLIIPVDTLFHSPSNYMVHGELCSHYATHMTNIQDAPLTDLAQKIGLGPPLTALEADNLAQAYQDDLNPSILHPHDKDIKC